MTRQARPRSREIARQDDMPYMPLLYCDLSGDAGPVPGTPDFMQLFAHCDRREDAVAADRAAFAVEPAIAVRHHSPGQIAVLSAPHEPSEES